MPDLDASLMVSSFGRPSDDVIAAGRNLLTSMQAIKVTRALASRSATPYPLSQDLELAAKPAFEAAGFLHHVRFRAKRNRPAMANDPTHLLATERAW